MTAESEKELVSEGEDEGDSMVHDDAQTFSGGLTPSQAAF